MIHEEESVNSFINEDEYDKLFSSSSRKLEENSIGKFIENQRSTNKESGINNNLNTKENTGNIVGNVNNIIPKKIIRY